MGTVNKAEFSPILRFTKSRRRKVSQTVRKRSLRVKVIDAEKTSVPSNACLTAFSLFAIFSVYKNVEKFFSFQTDLLDSELNSLSGNHTPATPFNHFGYHSFERLESQI